MVVFPEPQAVSPWRETNSCIPKREKKKKKGHFLYFWTTYFSSPSHVPTGWPHPQHCQASPLWYTSPPPLPSIHQSTIDLAITGANRGLQDEIWRCHYIHQRHCLILQLEEGEKICPTHLKECAHSYLATPFQNRALHQSAISPIGKVSTCKMESIVRAAVQPIFWADQSKSNICCLLSMQSWGIFLNRICSVNQCVALS